MQPCFSYICTSMPSSDGMDDRMRLELSSSDCSMFISWPNSVAITPSGGGGGGGGGGAGGGGGDGDGGGGGGGGGDVCLHAY